MLMPHAGVRKVLYVGSLAVLMLPAGDWAALMLHIVVLVVLMLDL